MDESLKIDIAWASRILAMHGHGDYTLGHVSVRDGDLVHMKRNGIGLEEVAPADVLTIDLDGNRVAGEGRIHLEAALHTEVYRARPDVRSVVHAHPPYATAFGCTDAELALLNHDAVLFKDGLAFFDDTAELIINREQGASVARALGDKRVAIMRGHGVLVTGQSLPWAIYAALTLERVIRIQAIPSQAGGGCVGDVRRVCYPPAGNGRRSVSHAGRTWLRRGSLRRRDRAAGDHEGAAGPFPAPDRHQNDPWSERNSHRGRRVGHRRAGYPQIHRMVAAGARARAAAGRARSQRCECARALDRHARRQPLLRRAAQRPGDPAHCLGRNRYARERRTHSLDATRRLLHRPAGDRATPRRDPDGNPHPDSDARWLIV